MDLTSLYLRAFFGARPFASSELDSLAERMGVGKKLSSDKRARYFITGARQVTAANLGNKVVFGRRYYESLSDEQRLAVGAHEFAHALDDTDGRPRATLACVATSSVLTAASYLSSSSVLLAECAFLVSFLATMTLFSSRDAERSRLKELECDGIAVSFVGSEAMISSIRLAGSMGAGAQKRRLRLRSSGGVSRTVEERTSAIVALRRS